MSPLLGPDGARVDIVADLHLEVDGSPVTVTADGAEVLVSVADPTAVLGAASSVPGAVGLGGRGLRNGVATWADRAAAAGLDVVVTGPRGVLLTIGPHARGGRLSRVLTGSDRVGFGSWSVLRGPLLGVARDRLTHLVTRVRTRR